METRELWAQWVLNTVRGSTVIRPPGVVRIAEGDVGVCGYGDNTQKLCGQLRGAPLVVRRD